MNADHEFQVNDNLYKKVRVHQLKKGDKLPKFELATDGGVPLADAYTLGAFCGDGFVSPSGRSRGLIPGTSFSSLGGLISTYWPPRNSQIFR